MEWYILIIVWSELIMTIDVRFLRSIISRFPNERTNTEWLIPVSGKQNQH